MANNFFDQTGVLVFHGNQIVTPMIRALFGAFNLDCNTPGNQLHDDGSIKDSEAYIAKMAEDNGTSLSCIASCIADEAQDIGIAIDSNDDEDDMRVWLSLLGAKFNVPSTITSNIFDDDAIADDIDIDLSTLFFLATVFNDGHNLKSIKTEAAWTCDKPRLFQFGGYGDFISKEVAYSECSTKVVNFASDLSAAISVADCNSAAEVVKSRVFDMLNAIEDKDMRTAITQRLCQQLTAISM